MVFSQALLFQTIIIVNTHIHVAFFSFVSGTLGIQVGERSKWFQTVVNQYFFFLITEEKLHQAHVHCMYMTHVH